jgi:dihydroxyacetone kinase-like predicted kinase
MKTTFKVSELNECEQKLVLAMLNNSPISSSFVCEALRCYIIDVLTTSKEELQAVLGTNIVSEKFWRDIARQFNKDLELGVDEYIETPRGRFYYGFHTMEDAEAAGYGYYFSHEGITIVGNGTRAVAVRHNKAE